MSDELKPGDVIHLGPGSAFPGCLAFVDEVRAWGVTANIVFPIEGNRSAIIPLRVDSRDFKRVGAPQYFVAIQFGEPDA